MSLFSDPRWSEALTHLPDYLGNHVRVSVTALALGLVVSLPLAIAARNRPLLRGTLLGLASIVQTVPGLALLALFYPLLLALAALSLGWFGFSFSAFGFLPAVLALALYSMLPVLRNTITGLRGVDPAILEAAQGVGMTPRQSLFTVELPLALPVMMAGIRTAAVWVIGTATLSTPIGQTSLGNYIFAGLQTQNWVFVLFGCLAAAVLALAVDQLLALIEIGPSPSQPRPGGARRRRHRGAGRGNPGALDGALAIELYRRRQDLCRAICVVGADRAAAARGRAVGDDARGPRLQRDFRCAGDRRYRRLRRLFRHAMGQPVPPHRHQAAPATARRVEGDAGAAESHVAWRTRIRERLCAGDAAKARRCARHSLDSRSRLSRIDAVDRGGLRILLAAGMGRAAKGLWAVVSRPAADAAGLHVCRGRLRRGRCDRGLHQRRADRQIRSGGAGRFKTRDSALRRHRADRTETRRPIRRCGRRCSRCSARSI